jgi:hypothetical protein
VNEPVDDWEAEGGAPADHMTYNYGPWVVVSAVEHPDIDAWVWERARQEARASNWTLGKYLGREGHVLSQAVIQHNPDLCFHAFLAQPDKGGGKS